MPIQIKYDLKTYSIQYNSFENIDNYDNVVYIDCSGNKLTSLPKLPISLQKLYCGNNKLTSLPELPNSLQELYCRNNHFIKTIKHKYLVKIIF